MPDWTRPTVPGAGDNGTLIQRAVEEIWNNGSLELADSLFAPTYINHGGLVPNLIRGPDAIKLSVILFHLAFPTLHIVVEDLIADPETVAFRWSAHRTRSKHGSEAGSSGLMGVTFSRFTSGQIVESWTYWDGEGEPSFSFSQKS